MRVLDCHFLCLVLRLTFHPPPPPRRTTSSYPSFCDFWLETDNANLSPFFLFRYQKMETENERPTFEGWDEKKNLSSPDQHIGMNGERDKTK